MKRKIPTKLIKVRKLITEYAMEYDSEFHSFIYKDANNNEFYYFHFKPRGDKSSVSDSICILNKYKVRYCTPMLSEWKSLIWVPINQKLNYMIISSDEVYEITPRE